MSFLIPGDLVVNATRTLALSALPDAPVEPDRRRRPPRMRQFLHALFVPATVENDHHSDRSPQSQPGR